MTIRRRIAVSVAACAFALAAPAASLACEPYTHADDEDWANLSDGVQWAFVGTVVDEVANPELPNHPQAMVIQVGETIAGGALLSRLRIEQDDGCDGFWYRKGDRVIGAIGHLPEVSALFTGITNYQVAVWVIRDGRVDGTVRVPSIAGRHPETERDVRMLLGNLPDTATIPPAISVEAPSPLMPFLAMGGILTASLTLRGLRRTRP